MKFSTQPRDVKVLTYYDLILSSQESHF